MLDNITAIVRMEEGYMRLTLEYVNPNYKLEICKKISEIESDLKIYPEVIHRRDSDKRYFTSIEFSGDDYTCDRTCGKFIQKVINELGIKISIDG